MPKQALDGKRLNSFGMDPYELVIIGRDTEDGPEHDLWDVEANDPPDEIVVDGMLEFGVKEDVIVWKRFIEKGKKVFGKELKEDTEFPIVIDGRTRTVNARAATDKARESGLIGKTDYIAVPTKVERGIDGTVAAILQVVMNTHRKERSPLTLAKYAVRLLRLLKDEERVARYMHWGVPRLREMINALGAGTPEAIKATETGQIAASALAQVATLPPSEQKEVVAKAIATGKTSTTQIRGEVRKKKARREIVKKAAAAAAAKPQKKSQKGKSGKPEKKAPPAPPKPPKINEADLPGAAPERKVIRAVIAELERMIDEDELERTTRMEADFLQWGLKWALDGVEPPPTIASILKRSEKAIRRAVAGVA